MFLNDMEETPHEKRFLSGDSEPCSGTALAMFGLTMDEVYWIGVSPASPLLTAQSGTGLPPGGEKNR